MAAEVSESKPSSSTADTYIGSLISLTSKSEIRYEGVLYNINPDESSIGLRNVRSFGTEGRKKDGPQFPPSDRIYEYILFRGSDIKDLQVKASPPVQPQQPLHPLNNDPAIIQSHYPRSLPTSSGLPSGVSGSLPDLNLHNAQVGVHGPNFQGGMPLYQPGVNLGSWGATPPPPNASGSGLPMPLYWQGFYGPANGLPHLPQQALVQPPIGLTVPNSLQQPMQYPNVSSHSHSVSLAPQGTNLPAAPSPLLSSTASSLALPPSSVSPNLASTLPSAPGVLLGSEAPSSSLLNRTPSSASAPSTLSQIVSPPALTFLSTTNVESSSVAPPILEKPNVASGSSFQHQRTSQSTSSAADAAIPLYLDKSKPSLVTAGQLLQSGSTAVTQSQAVQSTDKDVEVIPLSSSADLEQSAPVRSEAQPPILPLPAAARTNKPNGFPSSNYGYRGRGRRRDIGRSEAVAKFTEEFDFMAMNEKFNKDEVWGHLGKSSNPDNEESSQYEAKSDISRVEVKPVYNKDDFFDSLSSNTLDRESQNIRPRFSEQLRIDTETFGILPRYRGGRGGRGYYRGGRSQGFYGRGHGYGGGRGRGRSVASRAS